MGRGFEPTVTLFHCINASSRVPYAPLPAADGVEMRVVKLACSAMVQDVYLLRAFEAGSDAVVVLTCPDAHCLYVEGSLRARKRIERVKRLLDEIGLDGRRLSLFDVSPEDDAASAQAIGEALSKLESLGPSPAAQPLRASTR